MIKNEENCLNLFLSDYFSKNEFMLIEPSDENLCSLNLELFQTDLNEKENK